MKCSQDVAKDKWQLTSGDPVSCKSEQHPNAEVEEERQKRAVFLRVLIHELKTALTPVMSSSQLLLDEISEDPLVDPSWGRLASSINKGTYRLNDMIDDLLDLARGELRMLHLNLVELSLRKLLEEIVDDVMQPISSRGKSLSLVLPDGPLIVHGDAERLRQVITNLLNNAVKFTPEGGAITLQASEGKDSVTVQVHNTGRGIDEAERQRLFEPYFRLERDRERFSGLGLGLALCKELVLLHGGQIWVESEENKGTTFNFSIPSLNYYHN